MIVMADRWLPRLQSTRAIASLRPFAPFLARLLHLFLLYFCFQATLARPVRVSMMFFSTPSIPSTLFLRFPPYLSSTTVARTLIKIRLFCFSNECPFLLFEEIQSPGRYLQSTLIAFSQKYENSGDRFADFSPGFCGFVLLLEGTTRAAYFTP